MWGNPEAPKSEPDAKEIPGWVKLQADLQGMQGRIQVAETNLNKLLLQKRNLREGSSEAKFVVSELIKAHREYRRLVDEYRRLEAVLKFRYPERGLKEKFNPKEVADLEVVEQEVGIDAELNKTWAILRSKYEPQVRRDPAAPAAPVLDQKPKSVLESPAPQL